MADPAGKFYAAGVWLRDGDDTDLESMYQLDLSCFEPPFRFSRAAMRNFTRADCAFTVVAEDQGGGLAGFVVVQVGPGQEPAEAYVVTLDVRIDVRRQGVAGRLLRAAEIRGAKQGATRMVLHVWTENKAAIRFYEQDGYVRMLLHQGLLWQRYACVGVCEGARSA